MVEKEYLKNLSIKRDDKSLRRVVEIKLRIVNDLKKIILIKNIKSNHFVNII